MKTRATLSRKGFTLVELIVVIMILGILAAIGVPSYVKAVEQSKAGDGAALINMIGTTNRMFALDHAGGYANGQFTNSGCAADTACPQPPANPANPCDLISCKYLASQDFDSKPYSVYADNTAGSCSGLGTWTAVAGGGNNKYVACGKRVGGSGCYAGWGYAIDTNGVMYTMGAGGNNNCPGPPIPTQ